MWLPNALEEEWRTILDSIARTENLPTSDDPRVTQGLRTLSATYNAEEAAPVHASSDEEMAARLHFSFVRDVAKSASAIRELIFEPELRTKPSLDIVDLGAGLGAMSYGVARALRATGVSANIRFRLVDHEPRALRIADRILSRLENVTVQTTLKKLPFIPSEESDLILVGQVLSELHREESPEARVERHATFLEALLGSLREDGYLIVVEPALRTRTRHLHAIRRELLARSAASVYAPCLHEGSCPLFQRENDWCHEDLPIDLPPWLVSIARASGLRYEGLTFSYLVLRKKSEQRLADRHSRDAFRLVSSLVRTKGKIERDLCLRYDLGEGEYGLRARLLDRDDEAHHLPLKASSRGAILTASPRIEAERVRKDTCIEDESAGSADLPLSAT